MADYQQHLDQANKNLAFLQQTHTNIKDSWDWQVTICFYVAVHLGNAHLAKKINAHYRSHEDVGNALNFAQPLAPAKIAEEFYLAYVKLKNLSRRARYLCHDDSSVRDTGQFLTHEPHFAKAIKNLDKFMVFFSKEYGYKFSKIKVKCAALEKTPLEFFEVIK